jgi:hypothetical protein
MTSPSAFATTSAATVASPTATRATPRPPFVAWAWPSTAPTVAPVPAPTLPRSGSEPGTAATAAASAAAPSARPGRVGATSGRSKITAALTIGTGPAGVA